ncbi:ParB-like nuclease domain protein [Arthrobacter phage Salgado]|uniref:ParB-like nuclease domain protein n=2 Tax=Laroyevirus TaxID=1982086 RepID=A0A0U4INI9_9CAUD|nr:ParB-like partition protein [Arthrobacter phage LiSara]YP_010082611.1 ParB-like partition protein [Arthrobacter phage Salgado]ALY10170.1 ParB-like nuclease domain protein [Arthrobacter phage Salgado]ASR83587.1 PARB-like nuclease domain protein [Arthrobacter phage LiSara]
MNLVIAAETVPITGLKPHPRNPRIGNVDVIADSLTVNGQYKPVLVNRRNNMILAGTHTWKAARKLGWQTIAVNYIDVTDEKALQIVLADNRAADGGVTDENGVFALLATLPDLTGTGYAAEDLKLPVVDMSDLLGDDPADGAGDAMEGPEEAADVPAGPITHPFQIGAVKGALEDGAFTAWRAGLPKKNSAAAAEVLAKLGLTEAVTQAPQTPVITIETVPIDSLKTYPGNPRQGDVGRLMNSLREHGQFRPIVVSRRTRRILAGNNLTRAAAQLGWDHIGVNWVDVDTDGERRILIVDNRSSDLAGYDPQLLAAALSAITPSSMPETTGFTLEDLQDIIEGNGRTAKRQARAEATIQIGAVKAKIRAGLLADLNLTQGWELQEVAHLLNINPEGIIA